MSERLDRLEKIVESNSKAIEAWANESVEFRNRMEATTQRLEATTARIVDSIELLTQVVVRLDARQQDQESRINRLEQQ
jgi:allophanate hydrolase subunit 1